MRSILTLASAGAIDQSHDHHEDRHQADIQEFQTGSQAIDIPLQIMLNLSQFTTNFEFSIDEALDFKLLLIAESIEQADKDAA